MEITHRVLYFNICIITIFSMWFGIILQNTFYINTYSRFLMKISKKIISHIKIYSHHPGIFIHCRVRYMSVAWTSSQLKMYHLQIDRHCSCLSTVHVFLTSRTCPFPGKGSQWVWVNYDNTLGKILIFAAPLAARHSHEVWHWTMRFES